jgi:indoleamine 2,3-dioxygenase
LRCLVTHFSSKSATTREIEAKAICSAQWQNPYPMDQFFVAPENGFLPREAPLIQLPSEYATLERLLQRMSLEQPDGSAGLLATGDFAAAVDRELPEYDLTLVTDMRLLSGRWATISSSSCKRCINSFFNYSTLPRPHIYC